jgi:hypothetical protein
LHVSRSTGHWPTFSEDDVLDFMVREALIARGDEDAQEGEKRQAAADWKREGLSEARAATATPFGR